MNRSATTENTPANTAPERCPVCGDAFEVRGRLHLRDLQLRTPGTTEVIVCANCGSGTTLPVVDESQFAPFYKSPEGAEYSNYETWQPSGPMVLLSRALRWAHGRSKTSTMPFSPVIGRKGHALDVGCGTGDLALWMQERGWRMTGLEPDPAACEFARRRGVDAREGTLSTVELEPASFDAVIFQHVFEHIADPIETLRQSLAMLRPGGAVLITVPNFSAWQHSVFGDKWFSLEVPRHRHHFTPQGLARVVECAGFGDADWATGATVSPIVFSLQYVFFGRRVVTGGFSARLLDFAALLALMPVNWLISRLTGRGDVINLVAYKPS